MLWLALKLRRDVAHENPTIVIVTDRTDLDDQIQKTLIACGFPNPLRAESVRDLRHHLSGPTGITVMTTVQKFQELAASDTKKRDEHPTLSEAANIFVLTDEALRARIGASSDSRPRSRAPRAQGRWGRTGSP